MPERKHIEAIEEALGIVSSCRNGRIAWPLRLRVVNLLYKALAACDESPWRSMESAPKNSDNILLTNGKVVTCGFWLDEGEYAYWADACCDWDGIHPDPTHWMPLPAAPEAKP